MSSANQRQEYPKGASTGGRVLKDTTCRPLAVAPRAGPRLAVESFAKVCRWAPMYRAGGVKVVHIAELLGVSTHTVYRALRRGPLKTDVMGPQSMRDATQNMQEEHL